MTSEPSGSQKPIGTDTPIAVIEGPKGQAEIFELWSTVEKAMEYRVRQGAKEEGPFVSLGEAYLVARELTGAPHP